MTLSGILETTFGVKIARLVNTKKKPFTVEDFRAKEVINPCHHLPLRIDEIKQLGSEDVYLLGIDFM